MTKKERKQTILDMVAQLHVEVSFDTALRGAHCAMQGFLVLHVSALHLPEDQDDELAYWTSLHEIGHVKTWNEYPETSEDIMFNTPVQRACEAAAWEWALDHARIKPSKAVWAYIESTFGSYISWRYDDAEELPITRRIWGTVLAELA